MECRVWVGSIFNPLPTKDVPDVPVRSAKKVLGEEVAPLVLGLGGRHDREVLVSRLDRVLPVNSIGPNVESVDELSTDDEISLAEPKSLVNGTEDKLTTDERWILYQANWLSEPSPINHASVPTRLHRVPVKQIRHITLGIVYSPIYYLSLFLDLLDRHDESLNPRSRVRRNPVATTKEDLGVIEAHTVVVVVVRYNPSESTGRRSDGLIEVASDVKSATIGAPALGALERPHHCNL
mmetsp:Transcript_5449/g.10903  ORF Transcript_5449/g.10903 Transcript_5449/m.10903 type:complete len:237 (-) Transcript_5449:652-1362(-)